MGEEMMDANEQIKKFAEFIDLHYKADLLENARNHKHFLVLDFLTLSKFDPELADLLLDQPDEVLKAAEIAIQQFDLPDIKKIYPRITNLPESQTVLVRNIRSSHLGKFLKVKGIVRQKSDVRPQVTAAKFECPSCGNVLNILQLEKQFREPTRCGCGRKGKFRMLSKELVDAQGLFIEEASEDLEGGAQPKRINVFLRDDLVSPMSEKKTSPGQKIIINGQVKEIPIILRSGGQSTRFDLMIEANYVEATEQDFSEITIDDEEVEDIKALANDPELIPKIVSSIAPSTYGHDKIKEALMLQLMSGVRKKRDDGVVTRGDMHILLIGDPGAGKSQLLKRIQQVAPKVRFVSGKGTSGAGLSAAVVKDEFLQGWSLEAGALVLAHKGMLLIDELDKMSKDDANAMHEALEQQTVSISKANIQATLMCQTSVLAAANPKYGRFDPYDTVVNQIELPSTLINRFDLIFPIKDIPDETKDKKMAEFILDLHQNKNIKKPEIDTKLLRKYIAYAKQTCHPTLSNKAVAVLKDYYIKMRSSGKGEGGRQTIPISARQLEGLIRMTEAYAKMRLSSLAAEQDAKRAVEMLDYCLRLVAFDEETGQIDIDRIASDTTSSQRNKILTIKEIITELEGTTGKVIPLEDIVETAKEKGIKESAVEEVIQRLKRQGDIFEPKPGFISRI